jgi:DNA-binding transcriptional LysR family regulator
MGESEDSVNPNHQSPLEVIHQAMREIVSLHRVTVNQLSELIGVQRETTGQLHGVIDAMREVSALFREMTNTQSKVNDFLNMLSQELRNVAEIDETTRRFLADFIEQLQQLWPHLEEVTGQLVGFGVLLRQLFREQERANLLVLAEDVARRVPNLFCRHLTQLRWGVPGEFYDEIQGHVPEGALDSWLSADLVVTGVLRQAAEAPPLWIVGWVVPEIDESAVTSARDRLVALRETFPRVLPALVALRPTDDAGLASSQGVLVIADRVVRNWEEALARWLVHPE